MDDFVEQCRQEWKRLGVSDQLAEEMASDLAADLREAEAEGISAEGYLGTSAFDPHSFATLWAAERGIIPERPTKMAARRRPRFLVAFTVVSTIVLIVAALLLASGQPKLTLVKMQKTPLGSTTSREVIPPTNASAPVEWILLFLAIVALAFAVWLWSSWHRSRSIAAAK